MKFVLAFQPIFTQPLGFTSPGQRIVIKGDVPKDLPQQAMGLIIIETARTKYKELYPDDGLLLERVDPTGQILGGLITYDNNEEDLLQKASKNFCREFVEALLKEAVHVEVQIPSPLRKSGIIDPSVLGSPVMPPAHALVRGRR